MSNEQYQGNVPHSLLITHYSSSESPTADEKNDKSKDDSLNVNRYPAMSFICKSMC